MSKIVFLLILFVFTNIIFVSIFYSHSFFSSNVSSLANSFTTAASFPTGISPSTTTNPTFSPTVTPSITLSPTPTNIANHIVISEVQISGGAGELGNNDFIELYNPTNSVISLNGTHLVKRTSAASADTNIFTFTASHSIPSHGYFLWAHKASRNSYADTIFADVSSADTLAGNNSIALKQISGDSYIDALSWDASINSLKEGIEFSPDPDVNQSLERKALSTSTASSMGTSGVDQSKGNGYDTNNNATDFTLRTTSLPQNSTSSIESP